MGARACRCVPRHYLHNLHNLLQRSLRPRPRPRRPLPGRRACGSPPGLEDVRGRAPARASLGDRRRLRHRADLRGVQPAGLRGAAFRAAPADRRRLSHGPVPDHGAAHPGVVAGAHPPARFCGRAFVVDPVAAGVRRPGRPVPRDLLLGLLLHDARADRERADRSRAQHARQLRAPGRDGRAHSQRQPRVLSQPQPAAVFRRDGGAVREGDRYDAGAALPRRAGGGACVLDGWSRASRTRRGVSPSREAAGRIGAQSVLGRSGRTEAGVLPPRRRAGSDAPRRATRGLLSPRPSHGRERLGLLEPLAA